ncbi:hypothetical protein ACWC0A_10765 [Streptomyces scopuliridis]
MARDFGAGQPPTGELGQLLQLYRPVLLSWPASAAVVDVDLAAVEVTALVFAMKAAACSTGGTCLPKPAAISPVPCVGPWRSGAGGELVGLVAILHRVGWASTTSSAVYDVT